MSQSPVDPSARSFRAFLATTAAVLVIALSVTGLRSYRDLQLQRARERALVERIEVTDRKIQWLEERIDLLEDDPGTLERTAREELGMARPGDVVLRLSDAPREAAEEGRTPSVSDETRTGR